MGNWYRITLQKDTKSITLNAEFIGFTKDTYCIIVRVNEKTITIPRSNIIQMKRQKIQGRQR